SRQARYWGPPVLNPRVLTLESYLRWLRTNLSHFLRGQNHLNTPQILGNGGADQQIIKVLPLCDLLARHTQTFLDGAFGIRPPFPQPFLQYGQTWWCQKNRNKRGAKLGIFRGFLPDRCGALHVDV